MKGNTLKRVLSISAAAVCLASAFRLVPLGNETTLAANSSADIISAMQITEEMQIGWNIGNSLDAPSGETSWGNPTVTKELISAVKAKGFNTIRIPTTWYMHIDGNNNIDANWLARVKEVVDYAYQQDMYVILNLHHEEWINRADFAESYDEMSPKLIKLWQQIAAYFADYDQHLIFEGMNEPRVVGATYEWTGNQASYDVVNKLNQDFVNTVRSIESPYKDTRMLMVPSYAASAYDYVYKYMDVPDDEYICVSLHAYAPYNFTMNPDVDMSAHMTFTDAYKIDLDTLFSNMRTYFTDKDIPVVIGEFSASNYNNTEARTEWAEYYIAGTKKYGIPCVLWDNDAYGNSDTSEDHSYINRNTYEWYDHSEPVIDAMMSVINDDSIVWGGERKLPTYTHASIDSGKTLYKDSTGQSLDGSTTTSNCSANYDVTPADFKGKDIAIKFTGDAPTVAGMDSAWGNWTEIQSPYDVDEENGIAYYSGDTFLEMWGDNVIAHLCSRATGKTTIYQISIIDAGVIQDSTTDPTEPTTDPTEPTTDPATDEDFVFETMIYNIELPEGSKEGAEIVINLEGEPNANLGGAVGYGTNADDWVNINWSTTIGADGTGVVSVPISEIPAEFTTAQVQIWWSNIYDAATDSSTDYPCEMVDYSVNTPDAPGIKYGDADLNGEVELNDAVKIMCWIADEPNNPMTDEEKDAADVYQRGDGVNNMDALAIQKKLAQLISELPESYM